MGGKKFLVLKGNVLEEVQLPGEFHLPPLWRLRKRNFKIGVIPANAPYKKMEALRKWLSLRLSIMKLVQAERSGYIAFIFSCIPTLFFLLKRTLKLLSPVIAGVHSFGWLDLYAPKFQATVKTLPILCVKGHYSPTSRTYNLFHQTSPSFYKNELFPPA